MSNNNKTEHDKINQPGKLDKIFFYPKEFYVFDNFSSFMVKYKGYLWPTAEHAYQASKFLGAAPSIVSKIKKAKSAHDAQKIANQNKHLQIKNWDNIKTKVMKKILIQKVKQHPYVLKKLVESGNRKIIEDSWRDSNWGWGQNKNGNNLLGKLWEEVREDFKNYKL